MQDIEENKEKKKRKRKLLNEERNEEGRNIKRMLLKHWTGRITTERMNQTKLGIMQDRN